MRVIPTTLLAVCLLAASAPVLSQGAPVTFVTVKGTVLGPDGGPLSGLRVVLVAANRGWSFRAFRWADKEISERTATTDEKGEFVIEWPWTPRFNRFELQVGVPYRDGGAQALHVLETSDLSDRIAGAGEVLVAIRVADTSFLEGMRAFEAVVESPDEHRVFESMGQPQRVHRLQLPDRTETSWWYFDQGKLFRFVDGRLATVEEFEPVTQF